ncbi:MAG: hydantoinase/oxoprolinase family protein, partial [Gammaproteobacteria bacterium]|nr:hydantoinase/oxoprolinase family protein [Gammaproteobacteria bacterium]
GAGGGSIATVEPNLRFRVGPESAGASPGPAAYAAGGVRPTVTDANLVLNRIDPEYFLGGGMRLDAVAAREAVRRELARPLELTVQAAAEGVLKVAVANMAAAIRLSLYEKGLDPKDFALISFGGAGGLHAVEVAAELGARRVIFPTEASTLSAWGMLFSDVVLDRARSRPLTADADAVAPLAELAEALIAEASAELEQAGFAAERRRLLLSADMRYPGQAYEVMVPLEGIDVNAARIDAAVARFHDLHERAYAHAERRTTPEIVTLRLSAVGELGKPRLVERAASDDTPCKARRSVYLDGCEQTLPVYERDAIGGGVRLAGPLLVEDEYTTLFLPGGWGLARLGGGELVAERDEVDP